MYWLERVVVVVERMYWLEWGCSSPTLVACEWGVHVSTRILGGGGGGREGGVKRLVAVERLSGLEGVYGLEWVCSSSTLVACERVS